MSLWRRLYRKPSGAIPGALFTRIGVAALALLCGLLILTHSFTRQAEQEAEEPGEQPADLAVQRQAGARLAQLADREQQRRALEDRLRSREGRLPQTGPGNSSETAGLSLSPDPGQDPLPVAPEEELQLRLQMRLEDLRHRHDSLRFDVLAHSYRTAEEVQPVEAEVSTLRATGPSDVSLTSEAPNQLTDELDRLNALARAATEAALAGSRDPVAGRNVAGGTGRDCLAAPSDRANTGEDVRAR